MYKTNADYFAGLYTVRYRSETTHFILRIGHRGKIKQEGLSPWEHDYKQQSAYYTIFSVEY